MKIARLLALGCVMAAALPVAQASAQRVSRLSGEQLGSLCTKPAGTGICDSYISGVADAGALDHLFERNAQKDDKDAAAFCITPATPTADMRGKVVNWMKAHRDGLNRPAGEVVFTALHESYPCGGGK
ncbi:Rap1a/Tai family immunity protein [Komagataeibacter xylinus]|uniref:Rap1a/Tai family immunity protein n=1 Tax=Komagataeibacter xylinus TaxID=28448 RepID=UPI001031A2FA|nr:Rap1a/Tai family immunity protein [Komagataeibacter xylinus]